MPSAHSPTPRVSRPNSIGVQSRDLFYLKWFSDLGTMKDSGTAEAGHLLEKNSTSTAANLTIFPTKVQLLEGFFSETTKRG